MCEYEVISNKNEELRLAHCSIDELADQLEQSQKECAGLKNELAQANTVLEMLRQENERLLGMITNLINCSGPSEGHKCLYDCNKQPCPYDELSKEAEKRGATE